jgi:hypothetical protein
VIPNRGQDGCEILFHNSYIFITQMPGFPNCLHLYHRSLSDLYESANGAEGTNVSSKFPPTFDLALLRDPCLRLSAPSTFQFIRPSTEETLDHFFEHLLFSGAPHDPASPAVDSPNSSTRINPAIRHQAHLKLFAFRSSNQLWRLQLLPPMICSTAGSKPKS